MADKNEQRSLIIPNLRTILNMRKERYNQYGDYYDAAYNFEGNGTRERSRDNRIREIRHRIRNSRDRSPNRSRSPHKESRDRTQGSSQERYIRPGNSAESTSSTILVNAKTSYGTIPESVKRLEGCNGSQVEEASDPVSHNEDDVGVEGIQTGEEIIDQGRTFPPDLYMTIAFEIDKIVKNGLTDEHKKLLLEIFSSSNDLMLDPPQLKAELKSFLQQSIIRRDNDILKNQQTIAACLAGMVHVFNSTQINHNQLSVPNALLAIIYLMANVQHEELNLRHDLIQEHVKDECIFQEKSYERVKAANPGKSAENHERPVLSTHSTKGTAEAQQLKTKGTTLLSTESSSVAADSEQAAIMTDPNFSTQQQKASDLNKSLVAPTCDSPQKASPKFSPFKATCEPIWDPALVLNYISKLGPNEDLSLDKLTKKLVILLALATGERIQTLALIDCQNIKKNANGYEIEIADKTTLSINEAKRKLAVSFYEKNVTICPASALKRYLKETEEIRKGENKLFLAYKKPHQSVEISTVTLWIKSILKDSGIDLDKFTMLHPSTSEKRPKGIPINSILKAVKWTQKSEAFAKFYNRPAIDVNTIVDKIKASDVIVYYSNGSAKRSV